MREVFPFLSSLFSSFFVCPPLLSSPLLFSFLPSPSLLSPSLPFPSLSPPFPSLLFLHSPLFHSGANTTTNTTTNIITPPTPNLQPIKSLSALLTSHPINPPKKPQSYLHIPPKTKNILQQQNTIYTYLQVYTPTTYMFSIYTYLKEKYSITAISTNTIATGLPCYLFWLFWFLLF